MKNDDELADDITEAVRLGCTGMTTDELVDACATAADEWLGTLRKLTIARGRIRELQDTIVVAADLLAATGDTDAALDILRRALASGDGGAHP